MRKKAVEIISTLLVLLFVYAAVSKLLDIEFRIEYAQLAFPGMVSTLFNMEYPICKTTYLGFIVLEKHTTNCALHFVGSIDCIYMLHNHHIPELF